MNQKTSKFILVEPAIFNRVSMLIENNSGQLDNPKLKRGINVLLKSGLRTDENPVPDKNALGVLWEGNLIIKVEL